MTDESERRIDPRDTRDERLFAQIMEATDDNSLVGRTVRCSTLDVSASGLKVSLEQPLAKGSRLDLWVEVRGVSPKFFLSGKICWSTPMADDGGCEIGLVLIETDGCDLRRWQELFSDRAAEPQ